MPHTVLKLVGGVNTQETPTQNENGGISFSNLIRYFPDAGGLTLVGKLGGWTRFYNQPMPTIVRALWAWEDLNDTSHLAVGTQTVTSTGSALLGVITNNTLADVSPTLASDNVTPAASTTSGSPYVTITDNTTLGITNYDSVYITTQMSIGGVVLFGLYPCDPNGYLSSNSYTVQAQTILGAAWNATSTTTTVQLPIFTTAAGSPTVNVNLPNYTYTVGITFPVLMSTTVGGITLYGNYVVQSIVDANNFTISAATKATATATVTMNGGQASFIYSLGQGPISGGTGYGIGGYGSGGYGTGTAVTPTTGTEIDALDWTLDNWGEILISCPDRNQVSGTAPFQPVYQWDPLSPQATIIAAAPPVNDGVFVAMPQRQIVTWGSTQTGIQDPLLVSWCDVNNFNQWIPLTTNQAGTYRIPKGSRIVGAVQGPQQAVLWTDVDAWSMQYIGSPYVYSFNEIGTGCGLIGRKAAGFMNGIGYWMGPEQFFTLSSAGVAPMICPVWDKVFQNLDQSNLQKIRFTSNSRFSEIAWYYPSVTGGTGEVDSYVKYNVQLGLWDYGSLARTAWVDQSVLGPPIGADPNMLLLYQHETSNDADGQAMLPSFQTGYYSLNEGDNKTFVDLVWPDMKWSQVDQTQLATVQITFVCANYPGETPVSFGPYSVTQATKYFNTRLRARLVSVKISSSDTGTWWRTGALRYRYAVDGKF